MAPAARKKQTRSQTANTSATDLSEKPRIALKYAKTTKDMGTRLSRNAQHEGADDSLRRIPEDLLLDAADQEIIAEEEPTARRKAAIQKAAPDKAALLKKAVSQKAASKPGAVDQSHKNKEALNKLLKTMVEEEMHRQTQALDTSDDSSLPKTALTFARYLFNAPGQSRATNKMWLEKAMEKIRSIPMDIALQHGIAAQVQEAMTDTIRKQTALTAYQFGKDAVSIINYVIQAGEQ